MKWYLLKTTRNVLCHALSLEKASPATSERFWQGKNKLIGYRFAMVEITAVS